MEAIPPTVTAMIEREVAVFRHHLTRRKSNAESLHEQLADEHSEIEQLEAKVYELTSFLEGDKEKRQGR